MLNYDPDGVPDFPSDEAIAENMKIGLHAIHVICDEKGAKIGENTGVSFAAFAGFIPRIGDRIKLNDGKTCQVERIYFKPMHLPNGKGLMLFPNVYAVMVSD